MSINKSSKELTKSINHYLEEAGLKANSNETEMRMQAAQETILSREPKPPIVHFDKTSSEARRRAKRLRATFN